MAIVYPFAAVRPQPDNAAAVAAPPYDVVTTQEADAMAAGKPLSFLRVSRPEIELPVGTDLYAPEVYRKAAENYERLKENAPLVQEEEPVYYVYSLRMGDHRQTGIVAAASVDDYDEDVIRKHEKTRRAKEDDRTRHVLTLASQTGPVFLTYRDQAELGTLTAEAMQKTPLFDFAADDGVQHTVWRIPADETAAVRDAFNRVPLLYIADGHHRAAAASRARAERRDRNPNHTGQEEYNRFLAVIFPASELQILAYNRVVSGLNDLNSEAFLARVEERFDTTCTSSPEPGQQGDIHMYLGGQWYCLRYRGDTSALPPAEQLDVSILQENLLAPLLGIDDPRTDKRIDFVGGIRGTDELVSRVHNGSADVAFSMYPTTVDQLMAIADAGAIMPPKSTWFEPKLRDGLLCHDI